MKELNNVPSVVSELALEELVGGPEVKEEDGHVGDFAADELGEVPVVVMQNRPSHDEIDLFYHLCFRR